MSLGGAFVILQFYECRFGKDEMNTQKRVQKISACVVPSASSSVKRMVFAVFDLERRKQ